MAPGTNGAGVDYAALLGDLKEEVNLLDATVSHLSDREWDFPTPAEPWTIRDQLAHLADTDEVCRDQLRGGPRNLARERSKVPEGAWTSIGVARATALTISELVQWWRTRAAECHHELSNVDPRHRIEWGPTEMSAASMATARLMETWAHHLDILDALQRGMTPTPRLRHIARLAWAAIPYARNKSNLPPATEQFRLELAGPDDFRLALGPAEAANRITGDLLEFCMRAVQRRSLDECPTLRGDGPEAVETLEAIRAFA